MGLKVTLHLLIGKAQSPSQANTQRNQPRQFILIYITFAHFAQNILRNQVWKCCFLLKWQRLARPTPTETGQTGYKTPSTLIKMVTYHHIIWLGCTKDSRNKCSINVVLKTNVPICVRVCLTPEKNLLGWLPFSINQKCQLSWKIEFVSSSLSLSNLEQDL